MTTLHSQKIDDWFEVHQDIDGFWDFIHENEVYDAQEGEGDYPDELLQRGLELGRRAGNRKVYGYSDGDCYLTLYYIGEEQEILDRLQTALDSWLKQYPPDDDVKKSRAKLEAEIRKLEQEHLAKKTTIDLLKRQLEDLKQQEVCGSQQPQRINPGACDPS